MVKIKIEQEAVTAATESVGVGGDASSISSVSSTYSQAPLQSQSLALSVEVTSGL
jgi:hypothetical protein